MNWGAEATDWAAAITTGMLQKAGGLFQLLAEVDFGTSYGVKSLYFKSRTANVADAGPVRLARADVINWRNQANSANLSLGVNASDQLTYNGTAIQNTLSVTDTSTIDLTLAADVLSAAIVAGSIDNSLISNSAAIAYSKLSLTDSIANTDLTNMGQSTIKGRAAGAGTGDPQDLTATQATAILNPFVGDSGSGGTKGLVPPPAAGDSAANKFLFADGSWKAPPGSGDVTGPASSTAGTIARFADTTGKLLSNTPSLISNSDVDNAAGITYGKLNLSGSLINSDISGSAAIAYSKLNLASSIVNADVSGSAAIGYSKLNLASSIANADVSASAAIAYTKLNLSASVVNADIAAAAAIAVNKLAALTVSRAVVSDGSGFLAASATTATEIGYVSGVTSSIQTQLGTKLTDPLTTNGDIITRAAGVPARLGIGSDNQVLTVSGGAPVWANRTYEVINSQSATFIPGATNRWHGMTNNALVLSAGTWQMFGTIAFGAAASTAYSAFSYIWGSANGTNTSTPPTDFATGATGFTAVAGPVSAPINTQITTENYQFTTATYIFTITATNTIYLVPFSNEGTPANARITAYVTAVRLRN